jgi:hypothetical protein
MVVGCDHLRLDALVLILLAMYVIYVAYLHNPFVTDPDDLMAVSYMLLVYVGSSPP